MKKHLLLMASFVACFLPALSQESMSDRFSAITARPVSALKKEDTFLQPIGYGAFRIDMTKVSPGTVDKNYILSPKDKIVLKVWGQLQLTYTLTVSDDLYLEIPDVPGRVYVSGLPVGQVEDRVRRQMATVYATYFNLEQPSASSASLDIALAEVQDLRFLVQGEVEKPGSYSLHPSLGNIMYALASAGGIKDSGSLRNVKIRRGEQLINLDFYDFLIRGELTQAQTQIRNNDTIFVPLKRKEVTIKGEVKRPAVYELQEAGSEDLDILLDLCGGVKPTASLDKLLVVRVELNVGLKTLDINLNQLRKSGQKFLLQDQDLVSVFPTKRTRLDFVTLSGNGAAVPGEYQLKAGVRIKDFVADAGGLMPDAYLQRADLVRTGRDMVKSYQQINLQQALAGVESQNLLLQTLDELIIYNVRDIEGEQKYITLRGYVKKPGRYEFFRRQRLFDLLFARGGFQDKDFLRDAYLERGDIVRAVPGGERRELIKFHLGKLLEGDPAQNYALQSDDEVIIYSRAEIIGGDRFVSLTGHAKNPGQHSLVQGMRLYDLLYTAGGYQDPDYRRQTFLPRADLVRAVRRGNEVRQEILRFDLGALLDGDPNQNLELQSGDQVVIYAAADFQDVHTVEVSGQVRRPGRYPWAANMTLADLLLQAGGLLEGAIGSRAEIARLNSNSGSEARTKTLFVNLQGDFYRQPQVTEFLLESNDRIFVRRNPAFEAQRAVEVIGEVLYPGKYILDRPETRVSEIVSRAGGLKPGAFVEGAVLLRKIQPVEGAVPDSGTNPQDRERVVFVDDALLQDGDRLEIPRFENTVRIEGAVRNPISVAFQAGRKVKDYLEMAGGLTADADKSAISVIGPNGAGIVEKGGILFWGGSKIRPGTVIIVPGLKNRQNP